MVRRDTHVRSSTLFVLLAGAAFATSSPLARWARPAAPLFVAWARVALASIVLLTIDAASIRQAFSTLSRRRALGIAGAGLLLAAHFALFLVGLDRTSMPVAISLVSLEPLSVVLCAWLLQSVRPTRAEAVGVGVATLGAVLVAGSSEKGDHRLAGDLLVIGAVVLYGLYVAAARDLSPAIVALVSPGETIGGIAIALMLGDVPTLQQAVGATIVVGGAALAILGARAPRSPASPDVEAEAS